jgi:ABC-type multidrug transport system permease subunit
MCPSEYFFCYIFMIFYSCCHTRLVFILEKISYLIVINVLFVLYYIMLILDYFVNISNVEIVSQVLDYSKRKITYAERTFE